ncbi:MAG: hypothetical protein Q8L64_01995 [bacterium]|nr:hypothetical protein [bacterium]
MMEHIKNATLFLVISAIVQSLSAWLQSDFIESFLKANLITLLLALMAINTTTISVIMTKLREISDDSGVDFSKTINSMKESIVEQVILIVVAIFILILQSSALLVSKWNGVNTVTTILLITTFMYAVQILYDTAQGVFVIAYKENALLKDKNSKGQKAG